MIIIVIIIIVVVVDIEMLFYSRNKDQERPLELVSQISGISHFKNIPRAVELFSGYHTIKHQRI